MICPNCGKDQSGNNRFCTGCGYSFSTTAMPTPAPAYIPKPKKKSNLGLWITLVIVVILGVALIFGLMIYKEKQTVPTTSSGETNTAESELVLGFEPSPTPNHGFQVESIAPIATPTVIPSPTPSATSIATPSPTPSATPSPTPTATPASEATPIVSALDQKDVFLQTAQEIEQYSAKYLDFATNTSVIERESNAVYQKWDKLLNQVYQYLKTIMPAGEFKQLEKEELQWIKAKEGTQSGTSGAEYYQIGIEFTKDRCYYLISYIQE